MFRSLINISSRTRPVRVVAVPTTRALSASAPIAKEYPQDLSTNSKTKTDLYPDDKHSVNKARDNDTNDVQTSNLKGGLEADKQGSGGHATEGKDSAGGKAKAKKEFPEAPDVAIGMQDERGGRGGR